MKLVDASLLLHAVNEDSPMHGPAKDWVEGAFNGDEPVGLAWLVLLPFVRIATNPDVFPRPLSADEALGLVDEWVEHPNARIVLPGRRHWQLIRELLAEVGTDANLTSDAYLAALSIEHAAKLYSLDPDFSRFRGVRWVNPLRGSS